MFDRLAISGSTTYHSNVQYSSLKRIARRIISSGINYWQHPARRIANMKQSSVLRAFMCNKQSGNS
jgi:hypothetical protein